jgi:hypothetical protein
VSKQDLTIRYAQKRQPWTVPYARGVEHAAKADVPHILASHCVLHAAKSIGKLAAVFEELDHPDPYKQACPWGRSAPSDVQLATVKAMSADRVTVALRFANLYGFDLSDELEKRVAEKNGVAIRGGSKP